jgi:hypothetical protein
MSTTPKIKAGTRVKYSDDDIVHEGVVKDFRYSKGFVQLLLEDGDACMLHEVLEADGVAADPVTGFASADVEWAGKKT